MDEIVAQQAVGGNLGQTDFEMAESYFKNGDLRRAISSYRRVLRFERNDFTRAKIYLELTRIYRITTRMKNARLELLRAFSCLGLQVPKNSIYSFFGSFFHLHANLSPDFLKQSEVDQYNMVAILYEELGLSAYYLRQKLVLVQTIIRARGPCLKAGISRPHLNWYGGSACVLALLGMKKTSVNLMKKCHQISEKLNSPRDLGKALIWKALLYDYLGDPLRSAKLFQECLDAYGNLLDPFDLRLAALTLSTNYFSRGYFEKALIPLEKMKDWNSCFRRSQERFSMDASYWHSLGPKAMLGRTDGAENIVANFRWILTADKDDKWLITQYLGHLTTVERKTGMPGFDIQEIGKRFQILEMEPQETHFEASFYWISQSYLSFDHARKNAEEIGKFRKSLAFLAKAPRHPTNESHYAVLRAGLAKLTRDPRGFSYWQERATHLAQKIDNRWALSELQQIQELANE